jgi:AcrR family transcriptional regulator
MRVKKEEVTREKKDEIMNIARDIIIHEGINKLSMRRIAKELNQVPGGIYHYFKNKEEILMALTAKEYMKIVHVISKEVSGSVQEQLQVIMTKYMELMIDNYILFDVMMHIKEESVQSQMVLLTKGLSKTRSSLYGLCQLLNKGCQEDVFSIVDVELRAQVIISATQGVIQRIAIENPLHQKEIIQEHINMILQSLRRK